MGDYRVEAVFGVVRNFDTSGLLVELLLPVEKSKNAIVLSQRRVVPYNCKLILILAISDLSAEHQNGEDKKQEVISLKEEHVTPGAHEQAKESTRKIRWYVISHDRRNQASREITTTRLRFYANLHDILRHYRCILEQAIKSHRR